MPTTTTESCRYRSLSQAARRIPPTKGDRPVHTSTLTRWIMKGVRKADGTVIKLRARRFPGGWKVTDEALDEFLDELTSAALREEDNPSGTPTVPVSARRQRQSDQVDRDLDAAGIVDRPAQPKRQAAGAPTG